MLVNVSAHGKSGLIELDAGQSLLNGLNEAGYAVSAPCGGRGTCGKCKVEITGIGQVLSCQVRPDAELAARAGLRPGQPLSVVLPEPAHPQISSDGLLPEITLNPRVFSGGCQLPLPSLADQRPDDERLRSTCGQSVPYYLLEQLPAALVKSEYHPRFYFRADTHSLLRFIDKEQGGPVGIAIDIGTTTLGSWLYDLTGGQRLAAVSMLNPQRVFGADVISRIEQASQSAERRLKLKQAICAAVRDLCAELLERGNKRNPDAGRKLEFTDLAHIVITGNTTMMHLLAGLPPAAIARTPFIPVSRAGCLVQAGELGLPGPVPEDTLVQLMPSIASYVGADITAGILACGLNRPDPEGRARYRLLLDIGTNGEIVLDGPDGLVACSTAAGPAFEGANIACGMGGVSGAIDEVSLADGRITYTVIGNGADGLPAKPGGICGSGLVAAIASLLDAGLIEETGRICDEPENLPERIRQHLVQVDGQTIIELVPAQASAGGERIYLNQKDIREVQNAKAAIAAGIRLLIEQAGLTAADVDQVFIAGGFGNYLDVVHALRIGMLPSEFAGRTRAVGNTAGMGAVFCLLDCDQTQEAEKIINRVKYYELSADKRFTELYVDAMFFLEE